jgi:hypothetical protein
MGREGVQYILIIMGSGVIKFQNFQTNLFFKKISIFKKFQYFHKISKLTYFIRLKKIKNKFKIFIEYFKICISWIWYFWNFEIFELKFYIFVLIFKFSNFLKLLGKFWPPTDGISIPLPMEYRPPYAC